MNNISLKGTYHYNIQWDMGPDSDTIFTEHIDGENVEDVIHKFRVLRGSDDRILSVEMTTDRQRKMTCSPDRDTFYDGWKVEDEMRYRVIRVLNEERGDN